MRLIPRHRHDHRSKALRISISQEEIAADLHYPAVRRAGKPRGIETAAWGARR
jgi:hypothetical protein